MTNERGIIFNGDSVQRILDGRKTQTRRVIKPQPEMWREILLHHEDRISVAGQTRQLQARKLGYGVVEVYKRPLGGLSCKEKDNG